MKKGLLLMTLSGIAFAAGAQTNVGIGTTTPNASAQLDVSAANKGFLAPRVTLTGTADATTIASPATGLMVFNTTAAGTGTAAVLANSYYYNSGTPAAPVWTRLSDGGAADWHTNGNAGTNEATDFLGTTDNATLNFRVNNTKSGHIGNADKNTFFGYQSGMNATPNPGIYQGIWNTGLGGQALPANTTGSQNTALGFGTLNSNTTGFNNIAIGYSAVPSNTTGYNNIGIGTATLNFAVNSNNNTAIGPSAMGYNLTGSSNVAVGTAAMRLNRTSSNLVAIGDSALFNNNWTSTLPSQGIANTAIGSKALLNNSDGSGNTATGFNALLSNTTGGGNTAIGAYADVPASGTISNATAVGYRAQVAASNALVLGAVNGVNGATAGTNVGIGTTAPGSTLQVAGSFAPNYTTVAANLYALTATDYYVVFNYTSNGGFVLPTPVANMKGRLYTIKNTTAAQMLQITPNDNSVETIDGATLINVNPGTSVQLVATGLTSGVTWEIVNFSSATAAAPGTIYTSNGTLTGARNIALGGNNLSFSGTGNVGIGNATPNAKLTVNGTEEIYGATSHTGQFYNGTSNVDGLQLVSGGSDAFLGIQRSAGAPVNLGKPAGYTNNLFEVYVVNGATVGTITTTGTAVAYNTTSDVRLKENIASTHYGLADLMKIVVKDYSYKADKDHTSQTGFLAQQLYTIYPMAGDQRRRRCCKRSVAGGLQQGNAADRKVCTGHAGRDRRA